MKITKEDVYIHLTGNNLECFQDCFFFLETIINSIYKASERVRRKYPSHTWFKYS